MDYVVTFGHRDVGDKVSVKNATNEVVLVDDLIVFVVDSKVKIFKGTVCSIVVEK
jgi:hypothetical protein